jgi:hypothetical protein
MLRTLAYHKHKRNINIITPLINYETFETRSTKATTNDHYLYYSDTDYLKLNMTKITRRIASSFPLFQHINSLVIHMPLLPSSSSNNLLNSGKKKTSLWIIYFSWWKRICRFRFYYSSSRSYSLSLF